MWQVLLRVGVSVCLLFCSAAQGKEKLVILNWEDYLNPDVVAAFESQFNVDVAEVHFDTEEHRDINMSTSRDGFDLVLLSGTSLEGYSAADWIDDINIDEIPNAKHMRRKWLERSKVGAPYMWGTTGLAYRQDLVKTPITHWKQVFEPEDYLKGKILLLDDTEEVASSLLLYLGHDIQDITVEDIRLIEPVFKRVAPSIRFGGVSLSENLLVTGEVLVAMTYNGDALTLAKKYNDKIAYVIPDEGCGIWVDYWAVLKSSKKKALAHQFLNFINDPKQAAANAEFVHFATANVGAMDYLSDSFKSNPIIYPDAETLKRCQFYTRLNPVAKRRMYKFYYPLRNTR